VKAFGIAVLVALVGYGLGVLGGIGLVDAFSSPKPDKSMEAVMTGFFYVGPAAAVLGFLGALFYQSTRRKDR
jgi:hypothetical protein